MRSTLLIVLGLLLGCGSDLEPGGAVVAADASAAVDGGSDAADDAGADVALEADADPCAKLCAMNGWCHRKDGSCLPASDADCLQSTLCKEYGACGIDPGSGKCGAFSYLMCPKGGCPKDGKCYWNNGKPCIPW